MPKYNLLEEGWIQCINSRGQPVELSIQQILTEAQDVRELSHPIPIVNASVLFLLETVLIRALTNAGTNLDDYDEWLAGYQAGAFNKQALTVYLSEWHDRFYLFDEEHPFLQSIIVGENFSGSAMKLLPHFSGGTGGNSATLFDHHTELEGIQLSFSEAANYLLAAHQYGSGGRIMGSDYFSESLPANGLSFFIEGNNLFETLYLNLLPYPSSLDTGISSKPADGPIWERNDPYEVSGRASADKGKTYQPLGLLDLLTWPGRKIQLIPEGNGYVREIKMRSGLKMNEQDFPWYANNAKGFYLRARENHAVWRDYAVLLQFRDMVSSDPDKSRAPRTIQWLHGLNAAGYSLGHPFHLAGLGMAKEAGKQKVYFYSEQRLPIPHEYLANIDLIADIANQLDIAEMVQGSLYGAMMVFAETMLSFDADQNGRKPDPKDKQKLAEHLGAERMYWGALENAFSTLVTNLPLDEEEAIKQWKESIRAEARKAFTQSIRLAGESVQALKAETAAKRVLEFGFFKHIDKEQS